MKPIQGVRKRTLPAAALAAALLLLAAPCRADGYSSLAKKLSKAAVKAGIQSVAVLPFEPSDSAMDREGAGIAERLTTRLVDIGGVKAVERSFLKHVLFEHTLEQAGAVNETGKKVGGLAGADAIVAGSYLSMGRSLRLQARLIDVGTGLIVAAAEVEVERDAPLRRAADRRPGFLLPEFDSNPPPLEPWVEEFLNRPFPKLEADGEEPKPECAQMNQAIFDMQRGIIDLKARHEALRIRDGLAEPGEDPAAVIGDNALKYKFGAAVNEWLGQDRIPKLAVDETVTLLVTEGNVQKLRLKCESRKGDL